MLQADREPVHHPFFSTLPKVSPVLSWVSVITLSLMCVDTCSFGTLNFGILNM